MDVSSGSPVFRMPSIEFLEQTSTTGLVSSKPTTTEIPPSLVLSSQSEEGVDYSREDLDFCHDLSPPDTSKFSYLSANDMEVTYPVKTLNNTSIEDKL